MDDEQVMNHAVKLAAAFVANGDVRLRGSTREDEDSLVMLQELLGSLCSVVRRAADLDARSSRDQ